VDLRRVFRGGCAEGTGVGTVVGEADVEFAVRILTQSIVLHDPSAARSAVVAVAVAVAADGAPDTRDPEVCRDSACSPPIPRAMWSRC
jgi:hypothetical protein